MKKNSALRRSTVYGRKMERMDRSEVQKVPK
jgi:hypothetical protein